MNTIIQTLENINELDTAINKWAQSKPKLASRKLKNTEIPNIINKFYPREFKIVIDYTASDVFDTAIRLVLDKLNSICKRNPNVAFFTWREPSITYTDSECINLQIYILVSFTSFQDCLE